MSGLAVANLAEMRTLVTDWADRDDLADSVVDDFINIAVQRTNEVALLDGIEAVATLVIATDGTAPVPSDYLEAKIASMIVGSHVYTLERRPLNFVESYASVRQGIPCYFARKGSNFVFAPAPSGVDSASLYYFQKMDTLVDDTDTNWFLTDATRAILYAALKELSVYVSDEDSAATWDSQWNTAVNELVMTYDRENWSGDTPSIIL